jgi:hypothetical protein
MGMDTKLSDYTKEFRYADFIVNRFDERMERFRGENKISL